MITFADVRDGGGANEVGERDGTSPSRAPEQPGENDGSGGPLHGSEEPIRVLIRVRPLLSAAELSEGTSPIELDGGNVVSLTRAGKRLAAKFDGALGGGENQAGHRNAGCSHAPQLCALLAP